MNVKKERFLTASLYTETLVKSTFSFQDFIQNILHITCDVKLKNLLKLNVLIFRKKNLFSESSNTI
jgi:hypothetical protein